MASGGDGSRVRIPVKSWNFLKFYRIASASKCQCHEYELLLENQKTRRVGNLSESIISILSMVRKYYKYIIYGVRAQMSAKLMVPCFVGYKIRCFKLLFHFVSLQE